MVMAVMAEVVMAEVVMADNMNAIQQIDNCFPDNLAGQLNLLVSNADWKYGWRSNNNMGYGHWNKDFTRAGTSNGLDVEHKVKHLELQQAWDHLKNNHFPNATLLRCYANSHTFGVEGYPHTDSLRLCDYTAVVYLNKNWRREWGGETIIYNDNTITHAEIPKFNKTLIFPGSQWHVAKAPSRICPDLRITLMFKFSLEQDLIRNKIQEFLTSIGVDNIKHGTSNLMNHLLRTYDLLRKYRFSELSCLAGALHSIFGTNIFTTKTLDTTQRSLIERIIGPDATDLVELFSSLDRPTTLELSLSTGTLTLNATDGTTKTVTQPTFDNLCAIEAMNLYEQSCLSKYPGLHKWFLDSKAKDGEIIQI